MLQQWLVVLIALPSVAQAQDLGVQDVARFTNALRAEAGLDPLQWDETLAQVARQHSQTMADTGELAHVLQGTDPALRVERAGYDYFSVGENLSFNIRGSREVVQGWLDSPPHRRNMLRAEFTEMGVGIVRDDQGRPYVTLVLARPKSDGPTEMAQFQITNRTQAPVRVEMPVEEGRVVLRPGETGNFSVSGVGPLPDVVVRSGSEVRQLQPEDGEQLVVRRGAQGLVVASNTR